MAIFVDDLVKLPTGRWCHMMTDGDTDELIAFAVSLGLKESYIQCRGTEREHFDLYPSKREMAIKLGAKEVDSRWLVLNVVRKRRTLAERS